MIDVIDVVDRIEIRKTKESSSNATDYAEIARGAVSFVGRLSEEKGVLLFLDAAKSFPDIPFALAGEDRFIAESGIAVPLNVTLYGFLSGDSLAAFYRNSRMLCFPSQWFEGFPNVILPAMLAEKPVIASRIGALPEIVLDHETGLLHRHDSVGELVACIKKLVKNPDLCKAFGANAKRIVAEKYSLQVGYDHLDGHLSKSDRLAIFDNAHKHSLNCRNPEENIRG